LDQVTQQNAALVEQAAAGAESLSEQAAALAQAVRVFKLNGQPPVAVEAQRKAAVVPLPRKAHSPVQPANEPPQIKRLASGGSDGDWTAFG
jgi:methyl-accepting chemotaxis protein